jgi:cathepsin F
MYICLRTELFLTTYTVLSGGLETEQEYPYSGRDDKCKFDKSGVKVTINSSVAISKDENGKT